MTASTVVALVRERGGAAALADVTLRAPHPHEVVVQVRASGVCPTDVFGIDGGAGERFPAVFGHEGTGVVDAVGDAVTRVSVGDRIILSFASCRSCVACAQGHPAYCERFAELNYGMAAAATAGSHQITTGWMGQSSWATQVLVHESCAVRIGDDVPWPVAATLGCGVLTGAGAVLNVLRPAPADALLVLGAGTTGLAAVMAAAHRGVETIIVSDPVAGRRALAQELGASRVCTPDELSTVLGDHPPMTHALDTVGTQATIDAAVAAIGSRGSAATVALKPGANRVSVSQSRLLWGRALVGVIEGDAQVDRDIPLLATLWRAGRLPVERLITEYAFDDVAAAIDDARTGRVIKPVLLMPSDAPPVTPPTAPTTAPPVAPARTLSNAPRQAPSKTQSARHGDRTLATLLREGQIDPAELPALWRSLPAVPTTALRGLWRGTGLCPGHPAHRLLVRSRWFGKLFRSDDDVAPLVCDDGEGGLMVAEAIARGGASLRDIAHDGVVTASMVYDGQPIIDHFTRVDADTVLGVMTGRDTAAPDGSRYFFVLERTAHRPIAESVRARP